MLLAMLAKVVCVAWLRVSFHSDTSFIHLYGLGDVFCTAVIVSIMDSSFPFLFMDVWGTGVWLSCFGFYLSVIVSH